MRTVKKEIIRVQRHDIRNTKTLDGVLESTLGDMQKIVRLYQLGYITADDCRKMKQEVLNGLEKVEDIHLNRLSSWKYKF